MTELDLLKKEVSRLRRAISPCANEGVIAKLREFTKDSSNLEEFAKEIRAGKVFMIKSREAYTKIFGTEPTVAEVADMGRAFRALLWEPTARDGTRVFYKSEVDYADDGY